MLTDEELRRAVFAMSIIDERGDPDVLDLLLREANDARPAGEGWNNLTLGLQLIIGQEAYRLSTLLGVPVERCEEAGLDVLGPGRQRLRFNAIIKYAIELIGPCRELTGESPFVPYADRHAEPAAAQSARRASTIRIVGNREAVA